jgi:uncharacterized repeat protein (TIGR03847 family)
MSARIISFEEPDRFITGTVGEPGERTFFLQVCEGPRLISVSLEKAQVQALAERLTLILKEMRQSNPNLKIASLPSDNRPLDTPIEEEFRVGVIGLAVDSQSSHIQIDLQAVTENIGLNSDSSEQDDLTLDQDILRIRISPALATAFTKRAQSVVDAGRQPCPFCGGPIDTRGHLCPRANGYRR